MLKYTHQSFTDYCKLREELFSQILLETPSHWHWFIKHCVFEIYDVCRDDGLDIREITFDQIKEKYGGLRIYYTTPYQNLYVTMIFENMDNKAKECVFISHNSLVGKIDHIIRKYENLIRNLEKSTQEALDRVMADILIDSQPTQTQSTDNEVFTIDKHINNKL